MSWPLHILHLMTKFDFIGIQNLPCEQRFLSCMAFNVNQDFMCLTSSVIGLF